MVSQNWLLYVKNQYPFFFLQEKEKEGNSVIQNLCLGPASINSGNFMSLHLSSSNLKKPDKSLKAYYAG